MRGTPPVGTGKPAPCDLTPCQPGDDERRDQREQEGRGERITGDALVAPQRNDRQVSEKAVRNEPVQHQVDDAGAQALLPNEIVPMFLGHAPSLYAALGPFLHRFAAGGKGKRRAPRPLERVYTTCTSRAANRWSSHSDVNFSAAEFCRK